MQTVEELRGLQTRKQQNYPPLAPQLVQDPVNHPYKRYKNIQAPTKKMKRKRSAKETDDITLVKLALKVVNDAIEGGHMRRDEQV